MSRKMERLEEVERELSQPGIWEEPEKATLLGSERASLVRVLDVLQGFRESIQDLSDLADMALDDQDDQSLEDVFVEVLRMESQLSQIEFQRMFSGEMDQNNAYLEIQSGSGGTEAQDWAEMLLRMYLKWSEKHSFNAEVIDVSSGDVAGIKGATVLIKGEFSYGWLRTETGVHRLVRKSPFDSGNRRHTSFASVFVSPEIDENIEIDLNPSDVRVDTYRASGAGGQHVNRTDSAVRLTHLPTNTVVQCQSERSQHQNKDNAYKQLRAKLYELELQQRRLEQQEIEDSKADIGWGSQIRSYVLDQSRVKDLRTHVESSNPNQVLDGELDPFIEASLKASL